MNKTIRLSLILLFSCLPAMAQATIWYVNLNATGVQNGSSWADAFVSPQQGLNAAKSGDEVWVAKGSYYVYEIPIAIPFKLKSGVRLLGGFNGNETNKAQRDWILNATELYTLTCIIRISKCAQKNDVFPVHFPKKRRFLFDN